MKQLFTNIKQRIALWRLLGWNKTLYRFGDDTLTFKDNADREVNSFRVTIKRYYMDIESVSGIFKLRLPLNTRPYLYLLAAAQQGRTDNIYGFCLTNFMTAMLCTAEQQVYNDINDAITNYIDRAQKQAKAAPKASEFDDELALREVKANVERGQMTRQQRRKAEREARKNMKEGMAEIKAEEAANASAEKGGSDE